MEQAYYNVWRFFIHIGTPSILWVCGFAFSVALLSPSVYAVLVVAGALEVAAPTDVPVENVYAFEVYGNYDCYYAGFVALFIRVVWACEAVWCGEGKDFRDSCFRH